ncbi:MAG: response regulator [Patescibacteria group bacterium]|nr:response regulator [Patescibacteria group bacterium]
MTENNTTVLLVDDDDDFLVQEQALLERAGFRVIAARGEQEAQQQIDAGRPDLAVLDLMMGTPDAGFTLAYRIKKQWPDVPVIIVSSVHGQTGIDFDLSDPRRRQWLHADAFLSKPIRFEQLQAEIDRLMSEPPN